MFLQKSFLGFIVLLLWSSWTSAVPPASPAAAEKTVILLAMHGEPPKDFPKDEFARFFSLHA